MKRLTWLLLSTLALAIGGPALAQDKYPSKPVKIVVPYAPGGGTDITARLFGDHLKNSLGQQFVVENKPGAFGILAIEEMARSQARRLHADDRQRLDQRDHAGPVQEEIQHRLREGRAVGARASTSIRRSSLPPPRTSM